MHKIIPNKEKRKTKGEDTRTDSKQENSRKKERWVIRMEGEMEDGETKVRTEQITN